MAGLVRSVSGRCVIAVLVNVCVADCLLNREDSAGTTLTAAAFCWKWACEQMKHFLGKIYKEVF